MFQPKPIPADEFEQTVKEEAQEPVYENITEETVGEQKEQKEVEEEKKKLVEPKDDENYSLPELKGIVYGDMVTRTGLIVKLTARGTTLANAVDSFMYGVNHAIEKWKWTPLANINVGAKSYPENQKIKNTANTANESGEDDAIYEFVADKMEIEPRADGKVKVSFKMRYPPSSKYPEGKMQDYPELSCVQKPENIKKYFESCGYEPFTQQGTFNKAATYTIKYKIQWKYGKPNRDNKRYKDLVKVLPV